MNIGVISKWCCSTRCWSWSWNQIKFWSHDCLSVTSSCLCTAANPPAPYTASVCGLNVMADLCVIVKAFGIIGAHVRCSSPFVLFFPLHSVRMMFVRAVSRPTVGIYRLPMLLMCDWNQPTNYEDGGILHCESTAANNSVVSRGCCGSEYSTNIDERGPLIPRTRQGTNWLSQRLAVSFQQHGALIREGWKEGRAAGGNWLNNPFSVPANRRSGLCSRSCCKKRPHRQEETSGQLRKRKRSRGILTWRRWRIGSSVKGFQLCRKLKPTCFFCPMRTKHHQKRHDYHYLLFQIPTNHSNGSIALFLRHIGQPEICEWWFLSRRRCFHVGGRRMS